MAEGVTPPPQRPATVKRKRSAWTEPHSRTLLIALGAAAVMSVSALVVSGTARGPREREPTGAAASETDAPRKRPVHPGHVPGHEAVETSAPRPANDPQLPDQPETAVTETAGDLKTIGETDGGRDPSEADSDRDEKLDTERGPAGNAPRPSEKSMPATAR
jgi:hypothetical protein